MAVLINALFLPISYLSASVNSSSSSSSSHSFIFYPAGLILPASVWLVCWTLAEPFGGGGCWTGSLPDQTRPDCLPKHYQHHHHHHHHHQLCHLFTVVWKLESHWLCYDGGGLQWCVIILQTNITREEKSVPYWQNRTRRFFFFFLLFAVAAACAKVHKLSLHQANLD